MDTARSRLPLKLRELKCGDPASQSKRRDGSGDVWLSRQPYQKLVHAPTALLFVCVYVITVYALWIGIDFGQHWDEPIHYNSIVQARQSHVLLPRWYHYPSMIFWLSFTS